MDRGAWQATIHGVTECRTRLSDQHYYCMLLTPILFDPETLPAHNSFLVLCLIRNSAWHCRVRLEKESPRQPEEAVQNVSPLCSVIFLGSQRALGGTAYPLPRAESFH